jgi:hypothetical protein
MTIINNKNNARQDTTPGCEEKDEARAYFLNYSRRYFLCAFLILYIASLLFRNTFVESNAV